MICSGEKKLSIHIHATTLYLKISQDYDHAVCNRKTELRLQISVKFLCFRVVPVFICSGVPGLNTRKYIHECSHERHFDPQWHFP